LFEEGQASLEVHLAIPDHDDHGLNITPDSQELQTRYRQRPVLVRDENTGTEKHVTFARRNFRLLPAGEVREGYSSMPVARVLRSEARRFQLDPKFVPPLVYLSGSAALLSIVVRLADVLAARGATLSAGRRRRNEVLADFTTIDVLNFWLLHTINGYTPLLRHVAQAGAVHPERVYRMLLSLAGALTAFSAEILPSQLPAYRHELPGECFGRLDEMLRLLLATVIQSNVVSLPLKPITRTVPQLRSEVGAVRTLIYGTQLDRDAHLPSGVRPYLGVKVEAASNIVITKTPELVKVATLNDVERLYRQALPGIRLVYDERVGATLPNPAQFKYFSLDTSGEEWQAIVRSQTLAVYVPADFESPQLELVLLLP
jgi:type VI secretion system protein ImpJ